MSDRRFETDQIYDLPALSPSADHAELLQHQQREDQWRRTREPVAAGSPFLKFVTWQDLIERGLVTESDVVGNDDDDLDPNPDTNDPNSPDFVNEPRLAVYAREMFLPVTYACSTLTVIENDPAKPNLQVLLFDPDTYESAQFVLILPKEWPGRALRYRVYWSHGSGATAYDVSWDMTVHSYEDGESLLNDWATGLRITDTGGTANTLYITDESEPVTVNGNLAKAHDLLLFRITRLAPHDTDTLDVDARLHAVEFNIGEIGALFPPPGDPYWAYVSLLVQGGEPASGNLINRTAFADTATINNYADWSSTQQQFGANMIRTTTIAAAIDPFSSTGSASEYGREAATPNYTFECWVYIQSVANFASSSFFWSWWHPSGTIFQIGTALNTPKLRIRNGADVAIESATITSGSHFIQVNFEGDNYTVDVDGAEIYSGTNIYGRDLGGAYWVHVACLTSFGSSSGPSTDVYVGPFRFTRGISRPRGSIPTDLFPLY
jgi:hypothetical protein